MPKHRVEIGLERKFTRYVVDIGHGLLQKCGSWAKGNLNSNTKKIAVFSNDLVFSLYGEIVVKSLEVAGYNVSVWLMEDGEEYKIFSTLEDSQDFLNKVGITRSDAIISLGGGVVTDLAGFASSVYLRGIQVLQIPTTFLAMVDASVGGKTGINTDFGKNVIGTFKQPEGVLIDVNVLKTLDPRELSAGFCEAIKQGALGGQELFEGVANHLKTFGLSDYASHFENKGFVADLENLLNRQVSFKAGIVAQDEKEEVNREDKNSRKILNFGHTVAHALEKITDYRYFKHGEAVGYGMLVAGEMSKKLDILDGNSLNLLNDVVSSVGQLPRTGSIDIDTVIEAFSHDKKNLGESLQWVLLEGFGKPVIVRSQEISGTIIKESLVRVLAG